MGLASRGEVCPAEPPSGERLRDDDARLAEDVVDRVETHDDEHVEMVAFTGESGSVSKMALVRSKLARVFAKSIDGRFDTAMAMAPSSTPDSGITARRDALVPPPLESVTNEYITIRGPAASLPTLEIEVAAALAAAPDPGARDTGAERPASVQRAMPTPLVMMAPVDARSEAPESGLTRIAPVEQRPRFLRTPVPMPFTIPPAKPRARGARSVLQTAALIVAPPFIVMLGIAGMRSASDAPSEGRAAAAAAPAPVRAPPLLPPAEAPSNAFTPPVAASPTVAPSAPNPAAASATAHPRSPRPGHRSPRPARPPIPMPVNR